MKNFLLLALMLFSTMVFAQEDGVTKVFLIRHAEVNNDGSNDPQLSDEGIERANKWATMFSFEKIDNIYSTDLSRTQSTAKTIAKSTEIDTISSYTPDNSFDFEKFKKEIEGKSVIIVGHSNTTPFLANAFLGMQKFGEMSGTDFGNLYIITQFSTENTSGTLLKL